MGTLRLQTERLLAEVESFVQETLSKVNELRRLAEDVNERLSEAEASCPHPRLRATYAETKARHDESIAKILALLDESSSVRENFSDARFQNGIEEVKTCVERFRDADTQTLERLGTLQPVLEPVRDRVMEMPEQVGLTVVAVLVSPSCLVRWHFEALSEYLNRPTSWNRLIDGTGHLLKAALIDAGGTVIPFLGTAEVLFQLCVSQISKDRERIQRSNDDISRLFFLTDHLAELAQGTETARDGARRAKEFISQVDRDFDDDRNWLVGTLGSL